MHTAPLHTARKAIAVTGGGRVGSCAQGGDLNEMLGIAPARLTIALQVNGADALHDKLASASLSDARAHVASELITVLPCSLQSQHLSFPTPLVTFARTVSEPEATLPVNSVDHQKANQGLFDFLEKY